MGATHKTLVFIIAIVLTLSRASRWWRIFEAPVWWLGISTMVAAYKGLCVILHKRHARNLHPWEQNIDSEVGETGRNSFHYVENRSLQMVDRMRHSDEMNKGNDASFQHASRLTFGPENSFEHASWVRNTRSRFFKRCSTSRSGLRMTF